MFIRYQKVRNTVVGSVAAVGATVAAFFGFSGGPQSDAPSNQSKSVPARLAHSDSPLTTPPVTSEDAPSFGTPETNSLVAAEQSPSMTTYEPVESSSNQRNLTSAQLYVVAMRIANARAPASGRGKDVLGPASPWKLNLYDDDKDGVWDRGKLDTNRDDVDDEKWNFKYGRWEKDGGKSFWSSDAWVSGTAVAAATSQSPPGTHTDLARYEQAMKLAMSRAHRSGKGKDVLGASSPWKLNLYDDDKDGTWDRGKLDTNRDGEDDEKWNFKKGRWEKDGGATIWKNNRWEAAQK